MELNNTIIENIIILYNISAILIVFFHINNYKIILDINSDCFFDKIKSFDCLLSFIDTLLLLSFFKTGFNIINFDYKNSIFYYSILSVFQFIKPIIIYTYYNNFKLNVSLLFNIYSVILNIFSIKLIIRYKNINING
jgi:hypothetical protein